MPKKPSKAKEDAKKTAPRKVTRETNGPLLQLRGEIDRLLDDFSSNVSSFPRGRSLFDWAPLEAARGSSDMSLPHVDVAETDKRYEIVADLPGVDQKDINVELMDDILTLSGEKKEETEKKEKDYHLTERRQGSFKRSFRLPAGVDENKATADFKNGVLKIAFPKTATAQKKNRKIEIRAS